jgi:cytochrome c-type biogenesis protein CcmH/NrfF
MADSEQQHEVIRQLWSQLRCMCGECDRETLEHCKCNDAAQERERIANLVRARDTSRPDKARAVQAEIVRAYIKRFGEKSVVNPSAEYWNGVLALALPPTIVVTGIFALVALVQRFGRRKVAVALTKRRGRETGRSQAKRKR